MKHLSYLFLLLSLGLFHFTGPLFAQEVLLKHFTISSDGADILVEWEVKDEQGITEFQLYRKFNDDPTLKFVASIPVNGTLKYKYLDDGIFKNNGRVIQYELHIFKDQQIYKFFSIPLAHTPTSIQRTWGSIKSMFR
ncbi:MAG: hypothetical protein D6730_19635 [Bacteroidetes bacterium]|nr:MAG: hypothetical protein D6730_19635 [Bacteroidota bacterium]